MVGCGLPAYLMKFNLRGSLRIGLGMLPRGEVALIVAGIGLASGIINQGIFGISIMMTVITTMLAPPLLGIAAEHWGIRWSFALGLPLVLLSAALVSTLHVAPSEGARSTSAS